VTESANEADGSGSFGRKAQRKVVVQKLQAMLNENQDIRDDESRIFNLIATPGYPELIGEMITLNYDRGLTAFVIGDSPMRLTSDATSLNEWATNVNTVVEDNDNGLVSRDEYLGVYYPSGFTSDNAGNNIVVPSSHMVLRTFALNDQVAYPWFAPAGTRRGGVTNASSTGYINGEGEFVATALNEGVRDTLYANNVNPITFLTGAGLVVFGQKTRARNASALDRINVARLVVFLRSQLNTLAKPYLFEPNDKITRDEIKQQVESLMVELVGLRALFDFLVVCDETNNTPARIDRNELYVDIAIEPVKAVEFIYIPLRIKNTGEIAGL
jgi:phage tail sheath protein FI